MRAFEQKRGSDDILDQAMHAGSHHVNGIDMIWWYRYLTVMMLKCSYLALQEQFLSPENLSH